MSTCRAVIFDMDGLMLDTERIDHAACRLAAAAMGHRVEDDLYMRTIGRTSADTRLIFIEHYGKSFPYETFRTEWREARARIVATDGIPLKAGLLELVDHLHTLEVHLAVATSTVRAEATRLLSDSKLLPRFDALVCGDEVEHGKPAPDLFLKAARALGVGPSDCLVLEDSEPGVRAAVAAGMRVIVVPDLKPPSAEAAAMCVAVCRTLHEVQRFL
jgi:HAD superfamily hydrolase (TIGR01509 family)